MSSKQNESSVSSIFDFFVLNLNSFLISLLMGVAVATNMSYSCSPASNMFRAKVKKSQQWRRPFKLFLCKARGQLLGFALLWKNFPRVAIFYVTIFYEIANSCTCQHCAWASWESLLVIKLANRQQSVYHLTFNFAIQLYHMWGLASSHVLAYILSFFEANQV